MSISLMLCGAIVAAQTYDYLIVGAGTSGLLLATQLAKNTSLTVAVLEAGVDARLDKRIIQPDMEGSIQNTPLDWQFTSVPQTGTYSGAAQKVNRAKCVGGTSAMNFMLWNTASKVEYDAWEGVLGNQGWNWASIDGAIKAAENFEAPVNKSTVATYNLAYEGTGGPIYATMQKRSYSLYGQYLEPALRSLGVVIQDDKNGGISTGAAPVPLSIRRDQYTRSYSGSAYTMVQGQSNIRLITNATVARILWQSTASGQPLVANGLQYYSDTKGNKALATITGKQVILSAGALQTPQILELSGIGDPTILNPLGIQTKVNLPSVGTGLQDKLTFGGSLSFNATNLTDYGGAQGFLDYAQPSRFLSSADLASLKSMLAAAKPSSTTSNATLTMVKYLVQKDQPMIEYGWNGIFVNIYNLHPLSVGSVHINTSNALVAPLINPAYNAYNINGVSIDLWILARAVSYPTKTVAIAPPLNSINAAFSVSRSMTVAQIQDSVYKKLGQGQHLTGGAVMLPRSSGGVVDTNLVVYGTRNVRVVDSSVFPTQPGHHPQSLAYSIAMRAASILMA